MAQGKALPAESWNEQKVRDVGRAKSAWRKPGYRPDGGNGSCAYTVVLGAAAAGPGRRLRGRVMCAAVAGAMQGRSLTGTPGQAVAARQDYAVRRIGGSAH